MSRLMKGASRMRSHAVMKTLSLPVLIFAVVCRLPAGEGGVGKVYPSERKAVPNAEYGCTVTQWTQVGNNNHLYFNVESFLDSTHFLFYSDRTGAMNLFALDMTSGKITQMTDESAMTQSAWHLPRLHTVWFLAGNMLKALDTKSLDVSVVYTFTKHRAQSFAITCDGKYCVFAMDKKEGTAENHNLGPYALYRLDLASKVIKQITPDLGFKVSHVLTNPVDPATITYCWQRSTVDGSNGFIGTSPIRIWWVNIEGTDGGQVGTQAFGLHRTHEFWFPDGKHIGYSARYKFGPKNGEQFIGITTLNGQKNAMMQVPVSSSHNQVAPDNIHWVSDLYDGKHLVLFTIRGDEIAQTKILFDHGSSMNGQGSHPHPHFSPDGRYILFATDRSGSPQVYTVRVDLSK